MVRASILAGFLALGFSSVPAVLAQDAPPEPPPEGTSGTDESLDLAEDSRRILLRADQSRGNLQGVTWRVLLSSGKKRPIQYDVKARGYNFVARTRKPRRYRGDSILLVSNNMWFHRKTTAKPVPISQRQKLMGSASYGDIAATNYHEDFLVTEREDGEYGGEECWVMRLQKKPRRKTTYDKLRVWVSKPRGVSVQTEHYTVSGKLIKTTNMVYEQEIEVEGETRPFISEINFQDALISNDTTRMRLTNPRLKRVPRSAFDLNLLRR